MYPLDFCILLKSDDASAAALAEGARLQALVAKVTADAESAAQIAQMQRERETLDMARSHHAEVKDLHTKHLLVRFNDAAPQEHDLVNV